MKPWSRKIYKYISCRQLKVEELLRWEIDMNFYISCWVLPKMYHARAHFYHVQGVKLFKSITQNTETNKCFLIVSLLTHKSRMMTNQQNQQKKKKRAKVIKIPKLTKIKMKHQCQHLNYIVSHFNIFTDIIPHKLFSHYLRLLPASLWNLFFSFHCIPCRGHHNPVRCSIERTKGTL